MRTIRGVKRSRIALLGILLPLLAACSKTTTVTERRDFRAPGGSAVDVEERWGIAKPVKDFFVGLVEITVDALFLREGVFLFLCAWAVVLSAIVTFVLRDVD